MNRPIRIQHEVVLGRRCERERVTLQILGTPSAGAIIALGHEHFDFPFAVFEVDRPPRRGIVEERGTVLFDVDFNP